MIQKIKQKDLVTKANILVEATYKLTLLEQKFILSAISTIGKEDEDFKPYKFSIKEFWDLLELKGEPKYSEMRKMSKELMKKPLEIEDGEKIIQANWFSSIVYHRDQGCIEFTFAPVLKPYLLQLKNKFTSYQLENTLKMDSVYTIRLYELLKEYAWLDERTISISELRKKIGAENVYKLYGNFKQRALIPAQEEINQKTDIYIDFTEIRKGRAVNELKFTIKQKAIDTKQMQPRKGKKIIREEMVPEWLNKKEEQESELTEEAKKTAKEKRKEIEEKLKKISIGGVNSE